MSVGQSHGKAIVTFTLGVIAIATSQASDISECPEQCQCKRTNQTNQVTCVNQSLDRIPDNIPATVTLLDLHGNNLSSPTNVFQHLTQVQRLDLSFNNLNIIYPWDLKNSNLECLNLSNNHITVLQDVFQALTRLEVLNISNNSITTLNSSAFEGLSNLRILDLQQNRISDISSDAFTSLQSLTQIDLRNNNIKELPEKLFGNLTNLQEISLGNNLLTKLNLRSDSVTTLLLPNNSICESSMLDLPKLEVLDLSWNNLTSLPTDFFENVQNLSTLILDGNPIHFINQPVFKTLSKLQILSMKMMPQLSYLSKETFLGLETLEVLELCNNPHLSFIAKELFIPLSSLQILDLSFNALQSVYNESISELTELNSIDFSGNNFTCDCAIEWLIENIQSNSSIIVNSDELKCSLLGSKEKLPLLNISIELLHCSDVRIVNHSADSSFRIGKHAILHCYAESTPIPEITWITPRKKVLKYHNAIHLVHMNYLPFEDHNKLIQAIDDVDKSYSESETRDDRIRTLSDGSLFIESVMRGDAGKYKCIAKNPRNSTEVEILVKLDYAVLNEVKIWSLVVGFSCAGGFFLLNLTYSLTLAAVRRCVSQRRRQQIREIIESMDHYKTAHLSRIKENYNHQVGRIRDQYHYQLGRLREHHHTQMSRMGRMREGASQKVEKIRDNYNNQLGRLKDYSSTQLVQLRGKYNNQVDKIKDFGNDKLDRLHEKYKLKQQHVLKLLDMMNFDNCRTAFESECTRTESMILHSEVFTTDVPLHSPIDSISPSDSEYVTATSSKVTSKCASREKLNREFTDCDTGESNSEFSGPINPYLPDDCSENETHTLASTGSFYDTQLNEEVTSAAEMTNETPLYNREDEQRKLNMYTSIEEFKSLKFITCDKENTDKIQLKSFVMERGNTDETKTAKAESLPLLTHSTKQPEDEVNTNNSIKRDIHNGGKSSATNTHTVGHSKDIAIDMSDEGHGWTIRESVV